MCNWMGNLAWTKALNWKGKVNFDAAQNRTFRVDDDNPTSQVVGTYISANKLTFLKVLLAGHLAPRDQPKATLAMLRRFIQPGGWNHDRSARTSLDSELHAPFQVPGLLGR